MTVLNSCTEGLAAIIFSENFGSIANSTPISTGNTSLTYVRSGTAGSIVANSSNFGGSGADLGGGTGGSLTGIGVQNSLTGTAGFLFATFSVTPTTAPAGSQLFFGLGSGGTFTTNNSFATADLTAGFQFDGGQLQRRTASAWSNISSATIAQNSDSVFGVLINRTGAEVTTAFGNLANNSMDVVLNGLLVGDDLALTNSAVAITGFRVYQVNGSDRYTIDNILLDNSVTAVPEPSSIALLSLVGLGGVVVRRFRKGRAG